MKINLFMNSQSSSGETIANTNLDANTKFNIFFFMIKFLSSSTLMCQVESFQSMKLSYPLNPGLPKKYLLRCNIGIKSTPGLRAFFDVRVTHVNSRSNQGRHTATTYKRAKKRGEEEIQPESHGCRDENFYTTGVWHKRGHGTRLSDLFKNSRK